MGDGFVWLTSQSLALRDVQEDRDQDHHLDQDLVLGHVPVPGPDPTPDPEAVHVQGVVVTVRNVAQSQILNQLLALDLVLALTDPSPGQGPDLDPDQDLEVQHKKRARAEVGQSLQMVILNLMMGSKPHMKRKYRFVARLEDLYIFTRGDFGHHDGVTQSIILDPEIAFPSCIDRANYNPIILVINTGLNTWPMLEVPH